MPRLTTRSALVRSPATRPPGWPARASSTTTPRLTSDVTNWRWVGENVGYGPDVATVHAAFMNSPAHKANILDRDYTEVGIGAVVAQRPGLGRPGVPGAHPRQHQLAHHPAPRCRPSATRCASATVAGRQALQARLGQTRTGYYGLYTKSAVARFQRNLGWHGGGNCGPKTWNRLF